MQEEIDLYFESTTESMQESYERLKRELTKIRTGKANASMFDLVKADYYGTPTPIAQVANINTLDAKTITIQPWEKSMLAEIEKAIFEANMGFTPQNDGEIIRILMPPLTEERRRDLVKQVKALGEEGKVSIRSGRRDLMESIKKAVKDGYSEDLGKRAEENAQVLTKSFNEKIEKLLVAKEEDIMTV